MLGQRDAGTVGTYVGTCEETVTHLNACRDIRIDEETDVETDSETNTDRRGYKEDRIYCLLKGKKSKG